MSTIDSTFYIIGKDWFKAFCRSNPEVAQRVPQLLGYERSYIPLEKLHKWYEMCTSFLQEEEPSWKEMLSDPSRLFNADESGFPLCVKSGRVLCHHEAWHVYQLTSSTKQQITVMAGMNAIF